MWKRHIKLWISLRMESEILPFWSIYLPVWRQTWNVKKHPLDHITISWLHDIFNLRESFTVLHTVPVSLKSGFFVAVFNPIIEPYFKYDYIFSWYLDIVLPYWDQWMLSDSGDIFCVSVSLRKMLLFKTVLWPMTDASY